MTWHTGCKSRTLPVIDSSALLTGYDLSRLTVGSLGGHSALDVSHGAKRAGFSTVVVAKNGRERTYAVHYKTEGTLGCVDQTIVVDEFSDVVRDDVQEKLRKMNTIFVHNRYFWVYFDDFSRVENDFRIPMFGSRSLLKIEERDQSYNQYHLLADAGIRTPKIFKKADDIDRPVLVKASEAKRGYERAFFVAHDAASYESAGAKLEQDGSVSKNWKKATIEELIVGAPVNFNFFYSPLTKRLELLGTDMRRQTNLDGFLRMTADQQLAVLSSVSPKMIETGHVACTVKESLLEKAFDLGEKFVEATQRKACDPTERGIIGPFALQGAVVAEDGREDIVIFDVSLRIPGSPGTRATPYAGYLHGEPMSVGERIGREIRKAVEEKRLEEIVT